MLGDEQWPVRTARKTGGWADVRSNLRKAFFTYTPILPPDGSPNNNTIVIGLQTTNPRMGETIRF